MTLLLPAPSSGLLASCALAKFQAEIGDGGEQAPILRERTLIILLIIY